ncbi:hypothetical protein Cpir12675_004695 [Ceratocystis pirilliformis]|uniref:Uncharacterized protein n=1 Tax=Ceratocystis pirilliformis TaxID=259994 RepID=A0ABR3YUH8_9PEZI
MRKRKVTSIFDNNLQEEYIHNGRLELYQIFECLCAKQDIKPENMKWVTMDIDNANVNIAIRNYRKRRLLKPKAEIVITPKDEDDWTTFSNTFYYKSASTMVPGAIINKIVIKRQERQLRDIDGQPRLVNVMMFSFKKSPPKDASVVSSVDAYDANLASEDNVNSGLKDAEEASDADIKAVLEASGGGCSGTSSGS